MSEESHSTRAIALGLVPGTLLAGIAGGIVFPIFPIVGQQVGLSTAFIGLILAANRAVRIVISPFVGQAIDRYGGRRILLLGLVTQIFVIALYLAGMVTHHEGAGFLAGRLLHGVGSACVFVSAQALALQAGGPNRGGGAAGTVRVAIVLGVPIGLAAGGLLSDAFGEVNTFWVALASVTLALIGASFTVPSLKVTLKERPRLSVIFHALREKRMLAIGGLGFAQSFAAGGMVLTTLALLVEARHLAVLGRNAQGTAGLLMGLMSITDAGCTPFLGRLGDRLRAHAQVAAASAATMALGLTAIGLAGGTGGTAIGIVIVGVGVAGLGPSVLVLMGRTLPQNRHGAAAGLLQLCSDVGGMMGPLVGTAIFGAHLSASYLVTAGLVACFIPVALSLSRAEHQPQPA